MRLLLVSAQVLLDVRAGLGSHLDVARAVQRQRDESDSVPALRLEG